MEKERMKKYESAQMEIVWFQAEDIIVTSNLGGTGEDASNGEFGPLL